MSEQENKLKYLDKLHKKYGPELDLAQSSGLMEASASWLEEAFVKNHINIPHFLSMIATFFSTHHLIEPQGMSCFTIFGQSMRLFKICPFVC